MEGRIDYAREVKRMLGSKPTYALELVKQLSEVYNAEVPDIKLHVLLELRRMINGGEVEVRKVRAHNRFIPCTFTPFE